MVLEHESTNYLLLRSRLNGVYCTALRLRGMLIGVGCRKYEGYFLRTAVSTLCGTLNLLRLSKRFFVLLV